MAAWKEVVGSQMLMLMRRRQAADTAGEREGGPGRRISASSRAEESRGKEKVIATDRYSVAAAVASAVQLKYGGRGCGMDYCRWDVCEGCGVTVTLPCPLQAKWLQRPSRVPPARRWRAKRPKTAKKAKATRTDKRTKRLMRRPCRWNQYTGLQRYYVGGKSRA